jgi:uncharacterized membrane protein (DUF485 family)
MVGMLQILTYLLCVYLIFKGIEIFQIAWMSPKENNVSGMALGILMVVASIILGIIFAIWTTDQANEIQKNMNNIPKFP